MSQQKQSSKPPAGVEVMADKLFKTAFELFLGDLIDIVQPRLAAVLELDKARFLAPEQLPDFEKAGHRTPDLVAEVPMRPDPKGISRDPQFVVVHIDTEARFSQKMDGRMSDYGLHILLESKKPVVSICVFLSGGDANVTVREVKAGVEWNEEIVWEANRFRYLAFGLGKSLAEDYLQRPQPLVAGLAAAMRSKVWDPVRQKVECLKALRQRVPVEDIRRGYTLRKMIDKYLVLTDKDQESFEVEVGENKDLKTMIDLWQEDLDLYKAEGRAEGEAQGVRKAILLLAKTMKLEVDEGFEDKLNPIEDLDRLARILEQIPHVRSTLDLKLS